MRGALGELAACAEMDGLGWVRLIFTEKALVLVSRAGAPAALTG
jgi:hypothetical protein